MVDYSSESFSMNVCVSVVHGNNHPVKYCIFHKFMIYLGRMYSLHCKYIHQWNKVIMIKHRFRQHTILNSTVYN